MTIVDNLSQNIDQLFDDPWFSGAAGVSSDVPFPEQVAFAGHSYIIEPSKYQRITVPLQREPTDQSVEPGEQSLNVAGAWRRSQDNWFLGAGQMFLDNRFAFVSVYTHSGEDPSVRTRFWRSKGVNPWVEGQLTLLPQYENKGASASTGLLVCAVGTHLYFWDGASLKYTANPSVATPTWTTVTPPGGGAWPTVHSMTTDGTNLYLALGSSGMAITAEAAASASYMRPTPSAPTLVVNAGGAAGAYSYMVVATDANGFKSFVSAVGSTNVGPTTLSPTNSITVSWPAVPGAVSYDVLKTNTSTLLATVTGATNFTDTGQATSVYTPPTATTLNFQAFFCAYGNSFLIAGSGPLLVEVAANGFTTLLMKHYNPSFVWNCGGGSEVAIYVAGSAGNVSELYGIQLSTQTFGLGAPYIAGQVGRGEIINAIEYYQGVVVLCTSLGVRTAQDAQSNGFLTTGAVINKLGLSRCAAAYGPYVWFGIENFSEADGIWTGTAQSSGTGRLFLSEFSSPLIPAYTSDVLATDGNTGVVNSVTIWGGQPYFTLDASGVWGPESHGNLVPQGYLESGWVRYGTVEDKILISVDMRHDPLNGSVQINVTPFGGTMFSTAASTTQGTTGPIDVIDAGNEVGEAFQIIPLLKRSAADPTKGPVLRRWTVRSMIIAVRQEQILVPIIWSDRVKTPVGAGSPIAMDLVAEWEFLQNLLRSGGPFIYQEGALSYTCYVDALQLEATKWNDQKKMLQGLLTVKLLTVN